MGRSAITGVGSNSIPQPIVNDVPVVENAPNAGNAGNVSGEVNPQEPVQAEAGVAKLVGQLDVLLMRAAKQTATGFKADVVGEAAKAAALPKATVKKLVSLATAAQKSIRALDGFTGRQLADAMVRQEDGTVEWKPKAAAAKALKAAQVAQETLSSALADALGKASDAATQATLEEIMLQCDRRVIEIETLVEQMSEIVAKGGDKVAESADALASDQISAFTSGGAIGKFGRGDVLATLEAELKSVNDRLAGYAKDGTKALTQEDVDACSQELSRLREKFSEAAASGSVKVGDKTVFCDRAMLTQVVKLLDRTGEKIESMHRDIVCAAMRNFVENSIQYLPDEIFNGYFVEELADVTDIFTGEDASKLAVVVKRMNVFRDAAREYAERPTRENELLLLEAAGKLQKMDLKKAAACLDKSFFERAVPGDGASREFKAAFKKFRAKATGAEGKRILDGLQKVVKLFFAHIDFATAQLTALGKKYDASPDGKFYVSSWVLGAFRGEQTVSSLIEARVHGYKDSEIDARIDDSNVDKARTLGSGASNTVTLLTLKDGSEWVFKPEMAGRFMSPYSPLNANLSKDTQLTRINLAVQDTADSLGLNDVMVKTTAGSHKGQFGMFMEKAPGLTCGSYVKSGDRQVGPGKLSMVGLRTLDDDKFEKVVGRLMRKANRLQWFDILTGQGDRHDSNYLVDIDKETLSVTVKGIDNDASYSTLRTGLHTYTFPAKSSAQLHFTYFLNIYAKSSDDKAKFLEAVEKDPGLTFHKDGTIDIDFTKVANKPLVQAVIQNFGFKSVGVPDEMDSDLYDKLTALAPDAPDGGAARAAHLEKIATRFGADSAQYKCAVKRLDEAIDHARALKAAGKVYTAEQWETHDIQRTVAKTALKEATYPRNFPAPSFKYMKDVSVRSNYIGSTNLFVRDMHKTITSVGYHTGWFK